MGVVMKEEGTRLRALVTGGSNGLGRAICEQLSAGGWRVISVDIQKPEKSEEIRHFQCDLSNRQEVDDLLEQLQAQGAFDLVIFNAGISATGKFETMGLPELQNVMRVNAEAPMVLASRMAAGNMVKPGGRMSFVVSLSFFTGYPGAAVYAASKDALAVYAKSIRKPFAKLGITVSTVYPGPLRTEHAERHSPQNASSEKRMTAQDAASFILSAIRKNRKVIFPGNSARFAAVAGKIAPGPATWLMRKILYEKLDRNVY